MSERFVVWAHTLKELVSSEGHLLRDKTEYRLVADVTETVDDDAPLLELFWEVAETDAMGGKAWVSTELSKHPYHDLKQEYIDHCVTEAWKLRRFSVCDP